MHHCQVKRDVWQHADSQAKTFKDESSALKIENEALGQQLKTLQTLVAGMVAKEEVRGFQTLRLAWRLSPVAYALLPIAFCLSPIACCISHKAHRL